MQNTSSKNQTKTPARSKRQFDGMVVNANESKTIRVEVRTIKTDLKYRKQLKNVRKYPVHDEGKVAKVGDVIRFEECRPLSKTKRWRLVKVIKTGTTV